VRRFIFGLAAGIVVIGVLLLNKALGAALIAFVFIIVCREILRLTRPELPRSIQRIFLLVMSAGFAFLAFACVYTEIAAIDVQSAKPAAETLLHFQLSSKTAVPNALSFALVTAFYCWCAVFIAATLLLVKEFKTGEFPVSAFHFVLSLYTFVLVGMSSFLVIYITVPNDLWFAVCLLSWGADAGAFFTGRSVGKTPLCPKVSPKKTVEGFIAAIITGAISLPVLFYYTDLFSYGASQLPIVSALILALVGAIVVALSHLGDLFISVMKRESERKESGFFIPEHGGALDKIDSFVVAGSLLLILVFVAA
jgi:CDP-diglyceride synthetase